MRILVGYATARGATLDCQAIDQTPCTLGYDAFVVGSAIHNQPWLPSATRPVEASRS